MKNKNKTTLWVINFNLADLTNLLNGMCFRESEELKINGFN